MGDLAGNWDAWIGRSETREELLPWAKVAAWLATFDREAPGDGSIPQGFHWCVCLPDAATSQLGIDGHPKRDFRPDSFMPPVPLPRRMWAASEVEFGWPLLPGEIVKRTSRIVSITEKQGGTGKLVFVDLAHETRCGDVMGTRETQTIVYREPSPPGSPPAPPPQGDGTFDGSAWTARRDIVPSEALLFRYSALTFNSHRIHYDLPYATTEENYRGLVVHGPLTATLLLDLARQELGDNVLKKFAFRGVSPAICGEMLHLVLRSKDAGYELGAFAADGRQVMSATASV